MFIYCASWKLWRSRVKSIITVYTNPFDIPVEPQTGQTNDYNSISCFSAQHAVLRRKSKDWLAQNQGNVSEWSDMSIHIMWFRMYLMFVCMHASHSFIDRFSPNLYKTISSFKVRRNKYQICSLWFDLTGYETTNFHHRGKYHYTSYIYKMYRVYM